MAEFYSDLLTEIVTNKRRLAPSITGRGGLLCVEAKATVLAGHADGDIYRMFRVPSNGVPVMQILQNSAVTGGTDWDVGIYETGLGSPVRDKDVLIDGISFATASNNTVRSGVQLIADSGKAFWQLAGYTQDPNTELTVALTANVVGTADGTIYYAIFYNANN